MPFAVERFQSELQRGGLPRGLEFLNSPVDHRFTGVYRLHNSMLTSVGLHDKEGEVLPAFLSVVPLEDSFCQFVLRDGVFRTNHSGEDKRLDGHKYQGVMLSYTGVPIVDNYGDLFGTLCHFDALQRELADEDFELLRQAAKLLPKYLPK